MVVALKIPLDVEGRTGKEDSLGGFDEGGLKGVFNIEDVEDVMNGSRDGNNDSDGISGSCRDEGVLVIDAFSHARAINSMATVEGIRLGIVGSVLIDGAILDGYILDPFGSFYRWIGGEKV